MTEPAVVGDRITVKEDVTKSYEIMEGNRLVVRFLPGFSYRVTGKNIDMVNRMLAAGHATKGGQTLQQRAAAAGMSIGAAEGDVAASVSVKPKAKKARSVTAKKRK